jgi:hypothetical protein
MPATPADPSIVSVSHSRRRSRCAKNHLATVLALTGSEHSPSQDGCAPIKALIKARSKSWQIKQ